MSVSLKGLMLALFATTLNITVFSQTKVQKQLEEDLVAEYCRCLREHPAPDAYTFLSENQEACLISFLATKGNDFSTILLKFDRRSRK